MFKSFWISTRWAILPMLAGTIIVETLLPTWRWNYELFHVLVEAGGALIGFGLALVLSGMILKERLQANYTWLIACFLSMGTLDMAHSLMPPGQTFVWLHSTATFIGGLFAALIWLPVSTSKMFCNWQAFFMVLLLSIGFSLWSIASPGATLAMLDEAMNFTFSAKFFNITGGLGFLIAWFYFAREYHYQHHPDSFYFSNQFSLFALAGLLFESSALWDGNWWLWHMLRAFAYIALLLYFGGMYWRDITELSQLNAKLEKRVFARTAELEAIISGSNAGIISINEFGTIQSFSQAAEKIFGWSGTECIGQNVKMLMPEPDRSQHDGYLQHQRNTGKLNVLGKTGREVCGLRKDGSAFPMNLLVNRVEMPDKTIFVGLVLDISEQKNAQKQLIQSERLASLGQMVAGIAHEINTPLGTAVTNVSELEERSVAFSKKLEKGISKADMDNYLQDCQDFSGMAKDNLLRAAELVRSFKLVAVDQSSEEDREFDLKQHIEATLTTLHHEFKRTDIKIKLDCADGLLVNSYPGAISQIITNLAHNSLIHGFNNGSEAGQIQIRVSSDDHTGRIVLNYSDDGRGLDKEQRKKIFDPFFTTRRNQGGSGLGMNVVHNLVTDTMQGSITLDSNTGQGVHFQINIPQNMNA